jgi:hypothetical protein
MVALKYLAGIILALVALAAGGCTFMFLNSILQRGFQSSEWGILGVSLLILVVAGVGAYGCIASANKTDGSS